MSYVRPIETNARECVRNNLRGLSSLGGRKNQSDDDDRQLEDGEPERRINKNQIIS
jgi:hypothetical protein